MVDSWPALEKLQILPLHSDLEVTYGVEGEVTSLCQRAGVGRRKETEHTVDHTDAERKVRRQLGKWRYDGGVPAKKCAVKPDCVLWTHKVFKVGKENYAVVDGHPKCGVLVADTVVYVESVRLSILQKIQVLLLLDSTPTKIPLPLTDQQAVFHGDVFCGHEVFSAGAVDENQGVVGDWRSASPVANANSVQQPDDVLGGDSNSDVNAWPKDTSALEIKTSVENEDFRGENSPVGIDEETSQVVSRRRQRRRRCPRTSSTRLHAHDDDTCVDVVVDNGDVLDGGVVEISDSASSLATATRPAVQNVKSSRAAHIRSGGCSSANISSSSECNRPLGELVVRIFHDVWGEMTVSELNQICQHHLATYLARNTPCVIFPGKRFVVGPYRFVVWASEPYRPGIFCPEKTTLFFSRDPVGEFNRVHISPISDTLPQTYDVDVFSDYVHPFVVRRPFRVYGEGDSFMYKGVQFKIVCTDPCTQTLDGRVEMTAEATLEQKAKEEAARNLELTQFLSNHYASGRLQQSSQNHRRTRQRTGSRIRSILTDDEGTDDRSFERQHFGSVQFDMGTGNGRPSSDWTIIRRGSAMGMRLVTRLRIGGSTVIHTAGTVPPSLQDIVGVEAMNRIRMTPARYLHYQIQLVLGELFPDEYERVLSLSQDDVANAHALREVEKKLAVKTLILEQFSVTLMNLKYHRLKDEIRSRWMEKLATKKHLAKVKEVHSFVRSPTICDICGGNHVSELLKGDSHESLRNSIVSVGKLSSVRSLSRIQSIAKQCSSSSVCSLPNSQLNETLPRGDSVEVLNCAVCLSELECPREPLLEMPCAHVYHLTCVEYWFERSSTCPLCKRDVVQFVQWKDVPAATRELITKDSPIGDDVETYPTEEGGERGFVASVLGMFSRTAEVMGVLVGTSRRNTGVVVGAGGVGAVGGVVPSSGTQSAE